MRRRRRRRLGLLALAALVVVGAAQSTDRAIARADAARAAWRGDTVVHLMRADLAAGTRVAAADVATVALPSAMLPVDAMVDDPVGRRVRVDVAAGEVLRAERLSGSDGETAARVPAGTGAVALPDPAPHLRAGDRVDLHALRTGRRSAVRATVVDTVDARPLVAVADHELAEVVRALTDGGLVPVLVG